MRTSLGCVVCASLAAFGGAAPALHGQAASPLPPPVTAQGCLAQLSDVPGAPPTGHEQAAAQGLALTRATLQGRDERGAAPRSAVPGSRPSGAGTGTTDAARSNTSPRVEQSFWVVGAKAAELLRFLGRRVELTGTIDDKLAPNPGTPAPADAGAAAARRAATAPPERPAVAHPSAPSRAISVDTFRLLDEACS